MRSGFLVGNTLDYQVKDSLKVTNHAIFPLLYTLYPLFFPVKYPYQEWIFELTSFKVFLLATGQD